MPRKLKDKMAQATFAAGCFWGVQEAFDRVPGVMATLAGYTGGHVEDPDYKRVCTGTTGHAEAVRVEYDPAQVSYETLLDTFWSIHNPTTLNQQGPDRGSQYRSAIFVHDDAQRKAAEDSLATVHWRFDRPIVTEIVPVGPFFIAEDYHQHYLSR